MKIKIDVNGYALEKAHADDAGFDIRTPVDFSVQPHKSAFIDTCVSIELPKNTAGMIKSRSGLYRQGIRTEGVVDCGYTGHIGVTLFNDSNEEVAFNKGYKIAQLVIVPVVPVELEIVTVLKETERGDNGFGSTGK